MDQFAAQHYVRHPESADNVADANPEMRAHSLERRLRSPFPRVRPRYHVSKPQQRVASPAVSFTAIKLNCTGRRCISFPATEISTRTRLPAGDDRHVSKLAR